MLVNDWIKPLSETSVVINSKRKSRKRVWWAGDFLGSGKVFCHFWSSLNPIVITSKSYFQVQGTNSLETRQKDSNVSRSSCRWSMMFSIVSGGRWGGDILAFVKRWPVNVPRFRLLYTDFLKNGPNKILTPNRSLHYRTSRWSNGTLTHAFVSLPHIATTGHFPTITIHESGQGSFAPIPRIFRGLSSSW